MITEEKVKARVEKAAQKWIKNNISDEAIIAYVDNILSNRLEVMTDDDAREDIDAMFARLLGK